MKRKRENWRIKTSRGITLIALVITIVILIILATISVNLVLNGGIIERTQKTKTLTELSEIEERLNIIYADKIIEEYQNKQKVDITLKDVMEEIEKEGYSIRSKTIEGIKDIEIEKEKIEMEINSEIQVGITLVKRRKRGYLFCDS